MYARAAPPGRAGIALVALNGGQNVENANGLTVARLPDARAPPSGLTLLWDRLPSW